MSGGIIMIDLVLPNGKIIKQKDYPIRTYRLGNGGV